MAKRLRFAVELCGASVMAFSAFAAVQPSFPEPPAAAPSELTGGNQTAVFAGGCFWGVEAVFENVKGVVSATSGYAGGKASTAQYETVGSGKTGHAESVKIIYNPSQVSYGQLLKVFFAVAHDPTQKNRQGPDWGTQYRSVIFFANEDQKRTAQEYMGILSTAKVFKKPIVTELVQLEGFYPAETYHQDFLARNPNHPYIVVNDLPKLDHLRRQLPELCKRAP